MEEDEKASFLEKLFQKEVEVTSNLVKDEEEYNSTLQDVHDAATVYSVIGKSCPVPLPRLLRTVFFNRPNFHWADRNKPGLIAIRLSLYRFSIVYK